jgi:integrase/recombinase XerD
MKKKIILKRIFHRNEWRLAITFKYDEKLTAIVRSVNGVRWSQTNLCWYAGDNEATLKRILTLFREAADIDISEIVSIAKESPPPILIVNHTEKKPVDKETSKGTDPYPFAEEKLSPSKNIQVVTKVVRHSEYDPVLFTINEPDGRLVIKFTGRYDPEWVKELKAFGRVYYDGSRMEWLLRWSKMAVDSLSDYFSSIGIEIIVKKAEIPVVLKDIRNEQGNEVRDRTIGKASMEGIDLLKSYLEEKRYSKRTIESYLAHLELFFKYFHEKDPPDISDNDISRFIEDHIIKLGYSASYQNLIISSIKIFYSLCGERMVNYESLERPRRSKALPKVFSKEEVKKILVSPRNNKHKLLLWMIYSCGLRRSEITNLRLTDLDRERGILNIREGKGKVDRIVPVSEKVWSRVDEYINCYNPKKYLFEGQSGGRYSVESVYNVFRQALKIAGIDREVGVHSLRHSYATHLHESGLDIRYIQELLGHKSSRTTEIYTHVSRRNLFAIRSPIEDIDI